MTSVIRVQFRSDRRWQLIASDLISLTWVMMLSLTFLAAMPTGWSPVYVRISPRVSAKAALTASPTRGECGVRFISRLRAWRHVFDKLYTTVIASARVEIDRSSRKPRTDVEDKRKAGREGGRAGDVEDKRGAGHTRADLLEVPLRVDARPRSRRRCHYRCEGQYLEVRLSLHPRRKGEQHDGHPKQLS
jgi:hypothetical protein